MHLNKTSDFNPTNKEMSLAMAESMPAISATLDNSEGHAHGRTKKASETMTILPLVYNLLRR
jgi:hypothetical protein